MLLPVDLSSGEREDLSNLVLDQTINDLIFGVVTETNGNKVIYDLFGTPIADEVVAISKFQVTGSELLAVFDHPLQAGQQTFYVRFRSKCPPKSDMFFAKGWGLAKQGYIFRCLVNDIRGTTEIRTNDAAQRLLPIGSCYAFLIAHSSFVPVLASPSLFYSRLLEAAVWRKYLASCGELGAAHRYTIHQWRRAKPEDPISLAAPFRAYTHLHREFGPRVFLFYILGLLTPVASNFLVGYLKSIGFWHF